MVEVGPAPALLVADTAKVYDTLWVRPVYEAVVPLLQVRDPAPDGVTV